MTKRISQPTTVVVPVSQAPVADGAAVAAKAATAPAVAEAAVKADVVVEKAPVTVTVVADPAMALVAPAPLAMVAEPAASGEPAASSAAAQDDTSDDNGDMTAYIVGGVLLAGGILAVALSSGDTDPIPVTPAPTNTAPTFTSAATATVAENAAIATVVYDANAADTQGNAIVFTIGGTDAALFAIDASTGVVTLRNSANFETKATYSFTVTATDNGTPALAATQTIAVTVTNVNEAPTFASATATATVAENIPTTQVVYTAAATDADAGTTLIYSLSGTDAAAFAISAAGAVTFRASPDFEAKSSYTFVVTASDAATGGLTATQTVTVNVTDVVETPPVFTSGATATVAENAAITTVVYDANATGATTFTLGGADAALFAIDGATGVVTLRAPGNFEATPARTTFNITVTGTGPGGTATQAVVVSLTNVNEAPAFAAATTTVTIPENTTAVIAANTATDPDAGAAVTYTISGGDAALFNVNATTGAVTFRSAPDFEAVPTKNTYTFNLVASDGTLSSTQAVTVNVTDVANEPATVTVSLDGAGPYSGVGAAGAVQATVFTDDLTRQSNATITDFGRDDIVRFSSAADVRFSSDAAGLTIEFNNSGTVSQIRIAGVVGPDAIITSEASAEAAVNTFLGTTGVDYFRFG